MANSRSPPPPPPCTKTHARSISSPSSPSSFDQRSIEQHLRPDSNGLLESSESRSVESPSIDWRLSFPAFNIPSLSSPTGAYGNGPLLEGQTRHSGTLYKRAKDNDLASPGLSTPASDGDYKGSPFQLQSDVSFRSSPVTTYRGGSEQPRSSEKHPRSFERSFVPPRNLSVSSFPTERLMTEESNIIKGSNNKKSRLNLLNPMSLLARRRSSQPQKLDDLKATPSRVPAIPDFDPSIRGNIVHDFSSPRIRTPRRDIANDALYSRAGDSFNGTVQPTPPSPAMYSPVFKEHFHDEDQSLQPGQTAYLHNQQLDPPKSQSLPAFAQRLPVRLPSQDAHLARKVGKYDSPPPDTPPPPPPASSGEAAPKISPSGTPPRHKPSTSSRFSFQIAGQGSATQEKLLEDKHREHLARKPLVLQNEMHDVLEDDFDDFDVDAVDMFEEDVPVSGVADDWDIDENVPLRDIEIATSQTSNARSDQISGSAGAHSGSNVLTAFPTDHRHIQASRPVLHLGPTEDDDETITLSFDPRFGHSSEPRTINPPAHTEKPDLKSSDEFHNDEPSSAQLPAFAQRHSRVNDQALRDTPQMFLDGLKISTIQDHDDHSVNDTQDIEFDDGDLYFDDGEFDIGNVDTEEAFDESVFDEEYSQIRDIPAENAKRYQEALRRSGSGAKVAVSGSTADEITLGAERWADLENREIDQQKVPTGTIIQSSSSQVGRKAPNLTEGNLAAYHNALVKAATDAAADGRFDRRVSFNGSSDGNESLIDATKLEHHDHPASELFSGNSYVPNDNRYIYDDEDDADEDLLIAEANAEALENDDEGFYGQEFGFYARARGKETSDLINGGFFSARGANGIKRSHSGRNDFQEPSLTPITERSEWSARNSIASIQMISGLPGSITAVSSPGLNQLLDSPLLEDEMTLTALRKLRRGAFGGSSSSISSLAERSIPNSSPLAHVSTFAFPDNEHERGQRMLSLQNLTASMSIMESEEEDDETDRADRDEKPGMMRKTSDERAAKPVIVLEPLTGQRGHHRRSSSGAESVSYTQDSTGRWILERRRRGDNGEIEVIGREYLPGVHI